MHKGDGDPEGELPSDNGEGDCENGEGDCIVGKGQRSVLKREPLGKEEPDFFVSSISVLGSAFPTNTKKQYFTAIFHTKMDGIGRDLIPAHYALNE